MKILGIGSALPEKTITNKDLTSFLDTSDEWIKSRTGISERHVLTGSEKLQDIAALACRRALEDAGITGEQLDLIIGTTAQGDDIFPSIACAMQQALGASCPCVDLHAACTGFIYGLDTADAYIKAGKAKRVLVVSAEALSKLCDWTDRGTCVLFGDAAGAAVVGEGEGLLAIKLSARSSRDLLFSAAPAKPSPFAEPGDFSQWGIHMQGQDVFRFAVSAAAGDVQQAAEMADIPLSQVDWVLLHQANRRILETVRQRLGLKGAQMPMNIHRTGNTSSASVPLLLCDLYHGGLLKPGQVIAMGAFGAGMTSGACLLRWDKPTPPKTSDPAKTMMFMADA